MSFLEYWERMYRQAGRMPPTDQLPELLRTFMREPSHQVYEMPRKNVPIEIISKDVQFWELDGIEYMCSVTLRSDGSKYFRMNGESSHKGEQSLWNWKDATCYCSEDNPCESSDATWRNRSDRQSILEEFGVEYCPDLDF